MESRECICPCTRQTNKQTAVKTVPPPEVAVLTRRKVLCESTNPRESVFVANTWQHVCHAYYLTGQSPVYRVFGPLLPHPLPIVTKHELGLPFPPRNLRVKFGANPPTIFLVIVVTEGETHTQTDKPTPMKTFPSLSRR